MQSLKSVFGIFTALGPVVYCAGLIYYFLDGFGSIEEAQANGLGPTLMGLGVIGALFCIPLIVKIYRLVIAGSFLASRANARGNAGEEPEFDADATIARYMAKRAEEAAFETPASPAQPAGASENRASFGRRPARP